MVRNICAMLLLLLASLATSIEIEGHQNFVVELRASSAMSMTPGFALSQQDGIKCYGIHWLEDSSEFNPFPTFHVEFFEPNQTPCKQNDMVAKLTREELIRITDKEETISTEAQFPQNQFVQKFEAITIRKK